MCVYVYVCMCVCVYMCTYVCVYVYVRMCVCVYMRGQHPTATLVPTKGISEKSDHYKIYYVKWLQS